MARNARYLKGWQVGAVIVMAVLLLPMAAAYHWPQAHDPRSALAVFVVGYSLVVALFGFLAWGAWSMLLMSYQHYRDPTPRALHSRVSTLLRDLYLLCFASLFTVATVRAVIHLVREAARRAI